MKDKLNLNLHNLLWTHISFCNLFCEFLTITAIKCPPREMIFQNLIFVPDQFKAELQQDIFSQDRKTSFGLEDHSLT